MNDLALHSDARELVTRVEDLLGSASVHYVKDARLLSYLRWLGFRPACIYDVGASNTIWSVVAHSIYPEATFQLFEPLADISQAYKYGKLTHPAVQNFLAVSNHRIHPVALGSENKTASFRQFEHPAGSTSLEIEWHDDTIQVITVPMRRMDTLVADEKLCLPNLIKLDTQGSELEILKGAGGLLEHAEALFIECWLQKGYGRNTPLLREIANFLRIKNFELFDVGDCYRDESGTPATYDAVFVKTGSAWIKN